MSETPPLLDVANLSVRLPPGADREFAIADVSLRIRPNEIVCVVGESGSGKSMLANAVIRLLPPTVTMSGAVAFGGRDIARLPEAAMRAIRGAEIGMVFQEPMAALNPIQTVGRQIGEVFRLHTGLSAAERRNATLAALTQVHLRDPLRASRSYPHQLSGGERQRAMIAMALALKPRLLIADEPTTALDVTTQARILKLIRELQAQSQMGVLFITHDFGVVAEIADRVAVMQNGHLVEEGPVADVINAPKHAYTRSLIAAVPKLRPLPREPIPTSGDIILRVAHLTKAYRPAAGFFARSKPTLALDDVSISVAKGASLGIVGESGSGKSTLARCIVRLMQPDAGSLRLRGLEYANLNGRAMRRQIQCIQMVFQDTSGSLNPRKKVGDLVGQGLMVRGTPRRDAWRRAEELLAMVRLDPKAASRYPHEFSGGQRQRIALARALAIEPEILVADEPVSALDVSVQAQVLALLADLRAKLGLSLIFITHDLRVAANVCELVAVMKSGKVVEFGETAQGLREPVAPLHAGPPRFDPGPGLERRAALTPFSPGTSICLRQRHQTNGSISFPPRYARTSRCFVTRSIRGWCRARIHPASMSMMC
jgi:peptide/nickel transport system ATP-binding protein